MFRHLKRHDMLFSHNSMEVPGCKSLQQRCSTSSATATAAATSATATAVATTTTTTATTTTISYTITTTAAPATTTTTTTTTTTITTTATATATAAADTAAAAATATATATATAATSYHSSCREYYCDYKCYDVLHDNQHQHQHHHLRRYCDETTLAASSGLLRRGAPTWDPHRPTSPASRPRPATPWSSASAMSKQLQIERHAVLVCIFSAFQVKVLN